MNIKTVINTNTFYNADCIDFCPIEAFEHLFVVGTYELVIHSNDKESKYPLNKEVEKERVGRLYLYSVEEAKLRSLQEIDMPGILDVRWCNHYVKNKIILGLVIASGKLLIFSLENGSCLKKLNEVEVTSGIALYLDWSSLITSNPSPMITISDSKGYLYIYSFEDFNLNLILKFQAHKYETWATSFNYWNTNLIYTGADDCYFMGHDIRAKNLITFVSREHSAGVTSIQPSLWKDNLLFSGCYDGDLNSWDIRNMKSPIKKKNLGGGVWRLRCEPHHKPLILVSAMHNGYQVLEVDENGKSETVVSYSKHESLAYGADWSRLSKNCNYFVGSVSFYDKLLSLWQF